MKTSVEEFTKWRNFLPWDPWLIPIQHHGKLPDVPKGESWKNPRFRLTTKQVQTRLTQGKNIAIVATGRDYVLLDEDEPEKFRFDLDTLVVQTRNGKFHKYAINGGDVKNADGKGQYAGCGEVRAEWKYVLAPGSYVPPDADCADGATGLYRVVVAKELATLHTKDLPPEFRPTATPHPIADLKRSPSLDKLYCNPHGWPLGEIRAYDEKLDELLQGSISLAGHASASEADMSTLAKLLYWEYSEGEAVDILKTFRDREKLQREDYLQMTLGKIMIEETVSKYHDPQTWRPSTAGGEEETDPLEFFEHDEKGNWRFAPKKLADRIREQHRFFDLGKRGKFYSYWENQGIWKEKAEDLVRHLCTKKLTKTRRDARVREVVSMIREEDWMRDLPSPPDDKIVVANGVLDLKSGTLLPFDPLMYARAAFPVHFDPDAECPHILKFLEEITSSNSEDLSTLQEWFGYHLLPAYPIHKALMVIGDGANGKTTLLNLLISFVGKNNCSYIEIQELTKDRFAPADLFGKIANVADDISPNEITHTSKLKKITGESYIRVQWKNKDAFNHYNTAKASFSANKLPGTSDLSYAFFRRWILLKLTKFFEDDNCDKHLLKKLTTPEELSGLLTWALKGLERLLTSNGFTLSASAKETQADWKIQSNPIAFFIHKEINNNLKTHTPKWDIYNVYSPFCDENGFKPLSYNLFCQRLKEAIPGLKDSRPRIEGKQVRCWQGIELKKLDEETPLIHPNGATSEADPAATNQQTEILDFEPDDPPSSTPEHTFENQKYSGVKGYMDRMAHGGPLDRVDQTPEQGEEPKLVNEKGLQDTKEFLQGLRERREKTDQTPERGDEQILTHEKDVPTDSILEKGEEADPVDEKTILTNRILEILTKSPLGKTVSEILHELGHERSDEWTMYVQGLLRDLIKKKVLKWGYGHKYQIIRQA